MPSSDAWHSGRGAGLPLETLELSPPLSPCPTWGRGPHRPRPRHRPVSHLGASVEQAADSLDFGQTFLATSFLQHPWDGRAAVAASPSPLRPGDATLATDLHDWATVPSCKKPGPAPPPSGQRLTPGPRLPPSAGLWKPYCPGRGWARSPKADPTRTQGSQPRPSLRFQPRRLRTGTKGPELSASPPPQPPIHTVFH